jgi:thiamine kinase-like enzyme
LSAPDLAFVRSALRRLLPDVAQLPRGLHCEHLAGGVEQRSFLVTVAARQYVLRLRADAMVALLDIETEARVMGAVAAAGLAPRVIAADRETGALLTEYRPGATPWTPAAARAAANIDRAADLLRALHSVRATLPRFAATDIAERYFADLAAGGRHDVTLSEELARLARAYDGHYRADSLCHNDLVAANVLDGGGLVLVDFEYAVCGAPILDLASLAGMNDYTESQRRELLRAYYGERVPVTSAEFADVVRMVRLFAMFWALLAAGRSAEASGYLQLAEHMRQPLE